MNKEKYYLAIDIGASSGRHILSHIKNGKLVLEEVYRFSNYMEDINNHKIWDTKRLFKEIVNGMKKCSEIGKIPISVAIDTWGVDFVLLDENDNMLGDCVAYRDFRNEGMDKEVYKFIDEKSLYERTGIQKATFNTIYQLMAVKLNNLSYLENAESLLLMPDYFNFLLTGVKSNEYTIATTTQLINIDTNTWDYELIDKLHYPRKIFKKLSYPSEKVGNLRKDIQSEIGYDCVVIHAASHDTASAVMSVPNTNEDILYISSGTWSLLGTELKKANVSKLAMDLNFTNEGGYDYRYRFLKNIMGLWIIQSVKKELENNHLNETQDFSFANLCKMAEDSSIDSLIDVNDTRFLAPVSMIDEIQKACKEKNLKVPITAGELARVVYNSLAHCYMNVVKEVEKITGKTFDTINIVGGGSNASYLNNLTKEFTGKNVIAGPSEATAIGNIGAQMIADKVFKDINEFRNTVSQSF